MKCKDFNIHFTSAKGKENTFIEVDLIADFLPQVNNIRTECISSGSFLLDSLVKKINNLWAWFPHEPIILYPHLIRIG